jgi:hypothetical protein
MRPSGGDVNRRESVVFCALTAAFLKPEKLENAVPESMNGEEDSSH